MRSRAIGPAYVLTNDAQLTARAYLTEMLETRGIFSDNSHGHSFRTEIRLAENVSQNLVSRIPSHLPSIVMKTLYGVQGLERGIGQAVNEPKEDCGIR